MCCVAERNPFFLQERGLRCPAGCQAACCIHHTVTGIVAVIFRMRENARHEACVFWIPDQAGKLSVGRDASFRNFRDGGEHGIGKVIGQCGVLGHGTPFSVSETWGGLHLPQDAQPE